jgi:hypothetical protein
VAAQTGPTDSTPSPDELRRMFDARQYRDVVRHAVKVLQLKGESAAAYDRHDVLVLKAEAHLHLGDAEPAAKAFEEAAAAAPDEAAAAKHRATAQLARRAKQNVYKPRTPSSAVGAGEGLSLLDPVARKIALRALYDDERAAARKRLVAGERATLAELVAVLDAAAPIRTLELGATGAATESDQVLDPLSDRAHALMKDELKAMTSRVDKLDKAANKKRKMGSAYRKRGLAAEEIAELREIVLTCEHHRQAAQRFGDVVTSYAAKFTAIRSDAGELHERAQKVLSADYTGIYDRD